MVAILVQLLAELLLLGDVGLDRDVVGDFAALLADRRHRGQYLVVGAIFALVDEFAMPALAVVDGIPQGDIAGIRGEARAQQGRGPAYHFVLLVTAGGEEGGVDVLDARPGVGDEDAVRALFEGQGQLAQLLLGQLALGDVQMDAKEAHGPLLGVPIDAPFAHQPADAAIWQQDPELQLDGGAADRPLRQQLLDAGPVIRMQAGLPGGQLAERLGTAAIEAGAFRREEETVADHVPFPDADMGPFLGHQQALFALAQGAADGFGAHPCTDGVVRARRWVSSAIC